MTADLYSLEIKARQIVADQEGIEVTTTSYPLPTWAKNPTAPESVAELEQDMLMYQLSLLADEYNTTIEKIKGESEPVIRRFIAEAAIRTIQILQEIEGLSERVRTRLSLKVYRANAHVVDNENDFETMLINRLGKAKSTGTISEIKFMLEILAWLEENEYQWYVDEVFTDELPFYKLAKQLPYMRQKYKAIQAAKFLIAEANKKQKTISKAEKTQQQEAIGELEEEFFLVLTTAVEITQDKTVETNGPFGAKETLVKRVEQKKEERAASAEDNNKEKPVSPPPAKPEKPIATKVQHAGGVAYFFSIHSQYEGMIDRTLERFFEVISGDFDDIDDEISFYTEGGK